MDALCGIFKSLGIFKVAFDGSATYILNEIHKVFVFGRVIYEDGDSEIGIGKEVVEDERAEF